jgi:hypothetical protein
MTLCAALNLFAAHVSAHSSELLLLVSLEQQHLIVRATFLDGLEVTGAKLEYRLAETQKPILLREVQPGRYSDSNQTLATRITWLEISDLTFPDQITRLRASHWMTRHPLSLVMPPGQTNYFQASVLIPVLGAPVLLVLMALGWLLRQR